MCCCFELKSSEKQRKKLQLLIRSFLPQFCQVTVSVLLLPGISLFPVLLATNWYPCSISPSFCSTLFLGLQCRPWDPFLLVTWSIQRVPIQGMLHISPPPLTPGLFSFMEHIWRCLTAQERLYSFPRFFLFWAQSLLIRRMAPAISFRLARNFSLSSFPILFPKDRAGIWKW